MKLKTAAAALALCVAFPTTAFAQSIVAREDFDGSAINLTGTANVNAHDAVEVGDAFGVVSPGASGTGMPFDVADDSVADVSGGGAFPDDNRGIAGQFTTNFFAMNDMDDVTEVNPVPPNDATWTFDISSAASITSIDIDLAAMGDFEAGSSDGFLIEARVDAGPFVEIFRGVTDEAATKIYRPLDGGFVRDEADPLELFIDGVATGTYLDKCDPANGAFDTYSSIALAGQSGATLDVRVSWAGTPSGSEPMGIDNITILGETEAPPSAPFPAPFAPILGGALLGAGYLSRRRRKA